MDKLGLGVDVRRYVESPVFPSAELGLGKDFGIVRTKNECNYCENCGGSQLLDIPKLKLDNPPKDDAYTKNELDRMEKVTLPNDALHKFMYKSTNGDVELKIWEI